MIIHHFGAWCFVSLGVAQTLWGECQKSLCAGKNPAVVILLQTKLEETTLWHHVSSLENQQLYQINRQRYRNEPVHSSTLREKLNLTS